MIEEVVVGKHYCNFTWCKKDNYEKWNFYCMTNKECKYKMKIDNPENEDYSFLCLCNTQ